MRKVRPWVWPMTGSLIGIIISFVLWFVFGDGQPTLALILVCIALVILGKAMSNAFKLEFFEPK